MTKLLKRVISSASSLWLFFYCIILYYMTGTCTRRSRKTGKMNLRFNKRSTHSGRDVGFLHCFILN